MKLYQKLKHAIQYDISKNKDLPPFQMFQKNILSYRSKKTLITLVQDDNQQFKALWNIKYDVDQQVQYLEKSNIQKVILHYKSFENDSHTIVFTNVFQIELRLIIMYHQVNKHQLKYVKIQ